MVLIVGIILADLIVVSLFMYQYRQELGLTVNGSHDKPVVRKRFRGYTPPPDEIETDAAPQAQAMAQAGAAGIGTLRRTRRPAQIEGPR